MYVAWWSTGLCAALRPTCRSNAASPISAALRIFMVSPGPQLRSELRLPPIAAFARRATYDDRHAGAIPRAATLTRRGADIIDLHALSNAMRLKSCRARQIAGNRPLADSSSSIINICTDRDSPFTVSLLCSDHLMNCCLMAGTGTKGFVLVILLD